MKKFNNKAFFLVETMVVIAIVGIVITFLFKTFSNLYTNFSAIEYYDTVSATNASSQVKQFLDNRDYDYEALLDGDTYVELTNASFLHDDYYTAFKDNLGISKIYLINLQTFFTDNSIQNFNINIRKYLQTLKDDNAQYKLVVANKRNGYGSVSVYNYFLTLDGDPANEYAAYFKVGDLFVEPGYTALDNDDNPMEVTITGFVDTLTPGTYYLYYNLGVLSIRRKVIVYNETYDYSYTGNYQIFTAPLSGTYTVELWGAGVPSNNGKGAYTKGDIYLLEGQTLYIYVGESSSTSNAEAFNAGTASSGGVPGGGATDIRLISGNWENISSLRSRIMVAAGGGSGNVSGSHGGALTGLYVATATGGTQTAPGINQSASYFTPSFGIGGGGCGGGGGYYGGGGATCASGGAGGSSFVSGYTGCNAITQTGTHTGQTVHYSGFKFSNISMIAGNASMPSTGGSTETGHAGAGYARITVSDPDTINDLTNVRYIYNTTNGSTANTSNHWVEIQAIDMAGVNVALGRLPSSSSYENGNDSYWQDLTDGIITTSPYINVVSGVHWVILDLGEEYDLSSIRIWHYYGDSRSYYDTETRVAGNDETYRVIDDLEYMETEDGRIIRP